MYSRRLLSFFGTKSVGALVGLVEYRIQPFYKEELRYSRRRSSSLVDILYRGIYGASLSGSRSIA